MHIQPPVLRVVRAVSDVRVDSADLRTRVLALAVAGAVVVGDAVFPFPLRALQRTVRTEQAIASGDVFAVCVVGFSRLRTARDEVDDGAGSGPYSRLEPPRISCTSSMLCGCGM